MAEVAADQMEHGTHDDLVVELLAPPRMSWCWSVSRSSPAQSGLRTLDIRRKWAYLALARIFEHRAQYPDALDPSRRSTPISTIPSRSRRLSATCPSDEPDLGSRGAQRAAAD